MSTEMQASRWPVHRQLPVPLDPAAAQGPMWLRGPRPADVPAAGGSAKTPPEAGAASLAGLDALLRPHASERMVPTFLGEDDTLERCATADDLARLRAIRDAADPDGVLHEGRLPR